MVKRSTEEIITLAVCTLCMMGLSLFAVVRLLRGDYLIAAIDLIGLAANIGIFIYVYRTQQIRYAGIFLAVVALSGAVGITFIGGPDERYLLYPTSIIAFFLARPSIALGLGAGAVAIATIKMLPAMPVFEYGKFLLSISGCILFAYIFARERNFQRDELLRLSTRDALTGAGNRRAFDERLDEIIRMQQRQQNDISMLLIDVDNFKEVNDTEGHAVGDDMLRKVADTIQGRLRAGDNLYRYGGDEFVVIAATDLRTAMPLAEGLRQLIEVAKQPGRTRVTFSIGVTQHLLNETGEEWIKRTDRALFEAKRAGRNQVNMGKIVQVIA